MISGLSVLVLADIPVQPRMFSGLAFVSVSWLEFVFFRGLPKRQQGRGCRVEDLNLKLLGLALLRQGLGCWF